MAETQLLANAATPEARLKILQDIVNQLTLQERLAMICMISKRNDWISDLPVELLSEILSYLPLFHPWSTLNRVCKRWRDAFLSDDALRLSLAHHWNIHDPADSVTPKNDEETVLAKVRHIQAIRLGRPFTAGRFDDCADTEGRPLMLQGRRRIDLKGTHIAYIQKADRCSVVVLRDLVSGSSHFFHGTAREQIQAIALSSRILTFTSLTGQLYVVSLLDKGREPKTARLPSAKILGISADGYTVALRMDASPQHIALYDYKSGRLSSFDLPPSVASSNCVILVDSANQHVDHFHAKESENAVMTMRSFAAEHRRFSFDGKELCRSSWQRPPLPRITSPPLLGDLHPSGREGHFVFRSQLIPFSDDPSQFRDPGNRQYSLLCFDAIEGRLYEHHFGYEHKRKGPPEMLNYTSITIWKDVEFRSEENTLYTSTQEPPSPENSISSRYRLRHSIKIGPERLDTIHPPEFAILMNESFLVTFGRSEKRDGKGAVIIVYCFEEGLEWDGDTRTGLWDADEEGDDGRWRFSPSSQVSTRDEVD